MTEINTEQTIPNSNTHHTIANYFPKLNIYSDERSLSITEQLIATRLNLCCLIISLFILLMVRGFTPQIQMVTIISPTFSQFEHLINQYPSTLSCPCSQVNIRYNTFLSFNPEYHQICSSQFITQSWISSLFSINTSQYLPYDFRTSVSSQFQVLALLCRTASTSVSNALIVFGMENMINSHVLSRAIFDAQNEALIQHLQTTTIANVLRTDQFLALNIAYNHFKSCLRTNYFVYSVPGSRHYIIYTGYYLFPDYTNMDDLSDYCSCDVTFTCAFQSGIYTATVINNNYYYPLPPPLYSVPGILSGCIPRFSLLQSTLECLYDSMCLNITEFVGIDTLSYPPLNISSSSRFSVNTTIETMFNELFIEDWHNTSNFTGYFYACAPISCSYTHTERVSAIYIIISMISLMGGLIVAFRLLAFFFVKYIFRQILKKYCRHIPVGQEDEEPTNAIGLQQTIIRFIKKCWHHLLALNIYQASVVLSDIKQKQWATRICLFLLLIGVAILTIYSSVTSHSNSIIVHNPSRSQFEYLYKKYPLTLSCPCTHLSTSYSAIIHIQPRYHQICMSDFIQEDKWLLYFNMIPYGSVGDYSYYSQDFRFNAGSSLFRIMRILCLFANETITNTLTIFNNTPFVSNEPLPATTFDTQTSTVIAEFKQQTSGSFLSLFSLVRLTIEDNQFHVSTDTNIAHISYVINNTWSVRLKPRSYPSITNNNQTCTCLISNQCIRPQGFYCRSVLCQQTAILPNQTIPGLVLSCLPVSSLLLSTFECFYNQSCIQMLYDWRLFEIADLFYPLNLSITPLDPNLPSQFLPTTKLDVIVSNLLLEEWIITTNASAHYENCQPKICTYTYTARFEAIYVITTVIGLFGGLFVILHLSIPFIIRIPMQQIEKRRTRPIKQADQATNLDHLRLTEQPSLLARTKQIIVGVDIFNAQIENSRWATRVYFILLLITFIIIIVFTSLSYETQSNTVKLPSESTFETLYEQYSMDSFSCPCSQSSIPYGTFLSLSIAYHQVCSSDFILSYWWTLIASRGDQPFLLLDQPLLSNHFRMLSSFCTLSQQTVNNSMNTFISNAFISVQTLTRNAFENQIQSILNSIIEQTPMTFIQTLEYISDTFRSNQLEHLFLSNWMLFFTTATENYILATYPLSYNNDTCTCATSMSIPCWWPLVFILSNATNITLPGLVGGCLPIDGLRQSTLECLFDSVCLSTIQLLINSTTIISIPDPLNTSLNTRFPYSTTKIGTIIDQLFIEEWFNTTNYSAYYELCSPRACYYTYTTRDDILYKITSILGLYGGITISLRFAVAYAFRILNRIQHWWRNRH